MKAIVTIFVTLTAICSQSRAFESTCVQAYLNGGQPMSIAHANCSEAKPGTGHCLQGYLNRGQPMSIAQANCN